MTSAARAVESGGDLRLVGLAVSSERPPVWVGALAERLVACPGVELVVFVWGDVGDALPRRPQGPLAGVLWRVFLAADAGLHRLVCPASPRPGGLVDLAAAGLTLSREVPAGLSLVVDGTGTDAARALAAAAGAPVWRLDHDGGARWPGVASGYAETLRGDGATTCRLLELAPGEARPRALASAGFSTNPLVAAENRQQLLWKSLALVTRELRSRALSASARPAGDPSATALPAGAPFSPAAPVGVSSPPAVPTGAGRLALLLAVHAARAARFVGTRLTHREQWCLLLVEELGRDEAEVPWRALGPGVARHRLIEPPPDRYWADPHLLPGSDGRLVFVEEYPYSTRRGRIALLRLDDAGRVAESRTVVESDFHLSYPSLFEVDGETYLAPESSAGEMLTAYRCTDPPWRWEPAATLLRGVRAVDATIVHHGDRWWLFASVQEEPWLVPRDMLHIFSARDPLSGDWSPHPLNPVVCDPVRARPAGPLFSRGGRLYRPGQDCGPRYGFGVRIMEVVSLTPEAYEEREVAALRPPGGEFVATHTFAGADGRVVVDRLRWLRGRRG